MGITNTWREPITKLKTHLSNSISSQIASEAVTRRGSVKQVVLKNFAKFTGKHQCQGLFLIKLRASGTCEKETLAHTFSCEFCEIFKNTFFYITPLVVASLA